MRQPIKLLFLAFLALVIVACARVSAVVAQAEKAQLPNQEITGPSADIVKEIEAAQVAFSEAYTKQDAKALSAVFHPNAVFAGTLHPYWLEGKRNIENLWTYYFGTYRDAKIFFWSSSLQILSRSPTVAQHATATMAMPDATGRIRNIHMRLSIIWIRVPDYPVGSRTLQWQIAHMHGSEAPLFR